MISGLKGNWFGLLFVTALISLTGKISAATDTNSWSLTSPDGQCAITVSLNNEEDLSYEACRAGEIAIQRSPLGLRRDDQDFEHSLYRTFPVHELIEAGANFTFEDFLSLKRFLNISEPEATRD